MQIATTFSYLTYVLILYIYSKRSLKINGAMKNEGEQVVACDPFNILLKTTKQVLVMFLNWDQCTSFFFPFFLQSVNSNHIRS